MMEKAWENQPAWTAFSHVEDWIVGLHAARGGDSRAARLTALPDS